MKLTDEQLLSVVENTPLVSIDLVVRDSRDRILMGRRVNSPAKGKWFVPGGRIYKNENLDTAFRRICKAEIGVEYAILNAKFVGVFTHVYDDNFLEVEGVNTHYVVIAYELFCEKSLKLEENEQHSEFRWFEPGDRQADIHKYARTYFEFPPVDDTTYIVLNARRDSFNALLWETPVLSLTAQAFLFTVILSSGISNASRQLASALAFVIALASLQLFAKHRFMERQHAKLLDSLEKTRGQFAANRRFIEGSWSIRLKSYYVWAVTLWLFAVASAITFLFPRKF